MVSDEVVVSNGQPSAKETEALAPLDAGRASAGFAGNLVEVLELRVLGEELPHDVWVPVEDPALRRLEDSCAACVCVCVCVCVCDCARGGWDVGVTMMSGDKRGLCASPLSPAPTFRCESGWGIVIIPITSPPLVTQEFEGLVAFLEYM